LSLTQKYQMVEGTYTPASGAAPAAVKGRIRGNSLTLTVGSEEYAGTITGNRIEGGSTSSPNAPRVVATRIE